MKLGLIGVGYWGKIYAANLVEMGIEFTACTREYENLVLKNPEIKGIIIATPTDSHYEIAKKCLEYGKDVLVEKPFTENSNQGEKLINIKGSNILMVGHIYLYHPAIIKMKEILKDLYIRSIDMSRLGGKSNKNSLWELGAHDIYILDYLFESDPVHITNKGDKNHQYTIISYEKIKAYLETSTNQDSKIREIILHGNEETIIFDDASLDKKLIRRDKKGNTEIIIFDNSSSSPLKEQIHHFMGCIKNRNNPISDGENGLRNIKILEKCSTL